jgi:hypothetical protein
VLRPVAQQRVLGLINWVSGERVVLKTLFYNTRIPASGVIPLTPIHPFSSSKEPKDFNILSLHFIFMPLTTKFLSCRFSSAQCKNPFLTLRSRQHSFRGFHIHVSLKPYYGLSPPYEYVFFPPPLHCAVHSLKVLHYRSTSFTSRIQRNQNGASDNCLCVKEQKTCLIWNINNAQDRETQVSVKCFPVASGQSAFKRTINM